MKDEALKKTQKLREDISYHYYELSNPMESTKILTKLDTIIKLLKKSEN